MWLRSNARADAVRHDAKKPSDPFASRYPGDLPRVGANVRARFSEERITHAFQAIGDAVNKNNFDNLIKVPGIDPARIISGGSSALATFRANNAALIESMPAQMAQRVGQVLGSVDVRDLHVNQAKNVLADTLGVETSKAEFWARDQTLKLYADVNESRHAQAGVTKYEWGTSDDERVRGNPVGPWAHSPGDHFVLNKTIHLWTAPPVVDVTGRRCHPGKDYQCRCTAYPRFD